MTQVSLRYRLAKVKELALQSGESAIRNGSCPARGRQRLSSAIAKKRGKKQLLTAVSAVFRRVTRYRQTEPVEDHVWKRFFGGGIGLGDTTSLGLPSLIAKVSRR